MGMLGSLLWLCSVALIVRVCRPSGTQPVTAQTDGVRTISGAMGEKSAQKQ